MSRGLKFVSILLVCLFVCSCTSSVPFIREESTSFSKAQYYIEQSEILYKKAILEYTKALGEAKNPAEIYYKLGQLYYQHADYSRSIDNLLQVKDKAAQKLLAMAYYKDGRYTDALNLFNKLGEISDDEYLYFYALTCEYHNLYNQALTIYGKIHTPTLKPTAEDRVRIINESAQKEGLDPKIQELIRSAPSQDQYPQAGAIILFSKEDIDLKEDNTIDYIQHYLIKILNDRGKKYGEIEIGYDSTFDKVTIEFARVIRPDGKVISVGSKHIRDVSRYLNFPLYSNARVKIISMPEISENTFIEYKVKVSRGKLAAFNNFNAEYLLQSQEPIQYEKLTVTVPHGRPLHQQILNEEFNTLNANLKPQVTTSKNQDTYVWEFKDIPQIIPEPAMPPATEITPVIALSTFQSWDEIYKWWWSLASDKIEANGEMKAKITQLIQGKTAPEEKIRAIYNFCAKDIRYVAIEYGQAGYEPHRAGEIFSNRYGDCKDKAILLISMLKEIGIKAYPVTIGTKGTMKLQENFPTLTFNHAIVLVRIADKTLFLDPTAETALFGDLPEADQGRGVLVYLENKGTLMTTPKFPAEHNRVITKTILNFDDNEKIIATRMVQTSGIFDQSERFVLRYTMPKLIEEGIKEGIQEIIPASTLIDYRIDNLSDMQKDIVLSYRFTGSDFLIKAGPQARVIPRLTNIPLDLVSKDSRQFAIDFNIPQSEEEEILIKLPQHYQLKSLPEPIIKDTPWFRYENSYHFKDHAVTFVEKNISKANRVEPKDYKEFKSALEALSKDARQCIIVERTKANDG